MNTTTKTLIAVVIIETLLIGWLIYDKFQQKNINKEVSHELVQVKSDKAVIEEELNSMSKQYDNLKTNNKELNEKLEVQKEKIAETLNQLKHVKNTDRYKIKQLQDETETLKTIMKDFVKQIDELNTENKKLHKENTKITQNYNNVIAQTETLTYLKDSLSAQISIAKELKAENITILPLNQRDNSTSRARKFKKVKICFTLDDNVLAYKGSRFAYIRVAAPDGIILMNKESGMFSFQGREIAYSAKREVTYNGKKTDACTFYTTDIELVPGTYDVDIFMDSGQIGESKFTLK